MTTAIGIGASSQAGANDLLELIHTNIRCIEPGTVLATLDRRVEIASEVAARLGLKLVLLSAEMLAQVSDTVTRSDRSIEATGARSVAEAAALASLGPHARLIIPRRVGNHCTCAMATTKRGI